MTTLPIIRLTDEDIDKLQYFYFASGTESIIINYTDRAVLKLFKKGPKTAPFIVTRKNKEAKIERLTEKSLTNPIRIEAKAINNGQLVGYTLTRAKGRNMHFASGLDTRSKIEVLQRAKDILLDFHDNGIIHGDVKGDNVFFDSDGNVTYLDLDNMQVDELKVDSLNLYAMEYLTEHGNIFDESLDSYMFNLMTIEVLDRVPFGTPLMKHLREVEKNPIYQSSAAQEIIHDMKCPTPKVKEKYLIDHIKR